MLQVQLWRHFHEEFFYGKFLPTFARMINKGIYIKSHSTFANSMHLRNNLFDSFILSELTLK